MFSESPNSLAGFVAMMLVSSFSTESPSILSKHFSVNVHTLVSKGIYSCAKVVWLVSENMHEEIGGCQ